MQRHKELAIKIVKRLRKHNFEAYFAGGCVRDMVMRREPSDYDIATNALPQQVEKFFKKTISIGKRFGVVTVIISGYKFEVTTFRLEGHYKKGRYPSKIEFTTCRQDVFRRDFTVNALFYDPISHKIMDFINGRKDIKKKIIRTVGEPFQKFNEDYLRLIRAVRFASCLDFKIEAKTKQAIKKLAPNIKKISRKKIIEELVKILTHKNSNKGLQILYETDILEYVLPEIKKIVCNKYTPCLDRYVII